MPAVGCAPVPPCLSGSGQTGCCARGSPIFCWAGEGVFRSPVVSINDLVFLWWCSVFWPSPSPHRSSVCKSVVCHENDRAAQQVPVSFPFHLSAGPCQLPGGLPPLPTPPALLPDSSSLAEGPRASQPLRAPAPCAAPRGPAHSGFAWPSPIASCPCSTPGPCDHRPGSSACVSLGGPCVPEQQQGRGAMAGGVGVGVSHGAPVSVWGCGRLAGHGERDGGGSWVLPEGKEDEAMPQCDPD